MVAHSPVIRVVDDDSSCRSALTRFLRIAGYEVRGYGSAGEFLLDETSCDAPGCMLLDLFMPGPSDSSCTKRLRDAAIRSPLST
jgi:FixJ family two-component response regulator